MKSPFANIGASIARLSRFNPSVDTPPSPISIACIIVTNVYTITDDLKSYNVIIVMSDT